MLSQKTNFKAVLINYPEIIDEKTNEKKKIGVFTIGKKYKVFAVYDDGSGYTDFLVADNDGIFHWLNMSIFRAK